MFRYIAFIWNTAAINQSEAAASFASRLQRLDSDWEPVLVADGIHVLCAGVRSGTSGPTLLSDRPGVLLGTVFEPVGSAAMGTPSRKVFSPCEADRILASGLQTLPDMCWGRYVAIGLDSSKNRALVLRDPMGALPCFHTSLLGVSVICSCIEDCVQLGNFDLSIDWDFVATHVACSAVNTRQTGLSGVTEVLPGELLEIQRQTSRRMCIWNPLAIASQSPIEDFAEAAEEVRRVTKAVLHAWASRYQGILLSLSGGLDSSIVLGCVSDAPSHPRLACFNYYSKGCDGDERQFAHLSAQHAGVTLSIHERSVDVRIEAMRKVHRTPSPSFYLGAIQSGRTEARLARDVGADALFSGGGGDQLFFQARAIFGAADYLTTHGVDRKFFGVCLNVARLEYWSVWRAMWQAMRLAKSKYDPLAEGLEYRTLVNADTLTAVRDNGTLRHPYLGSRPAGIPIGKVYHAHTLSYPTRFYDPLGAPDDPEPVQPLLSQPLVELCLRIPSYVLMMNGWDRAVARAAFRSEVPEQILRRRSKGGMEENALEILRRNIDAAREMLLDGKLCGMGILDRRKTEEVLSLRPTQLVGAMAEIFDHLSTEAWLSTWTSSTVSTHQPSVAVG